MKRDRRGGRRPDGAAQFEVLALLSTALLAACGGKTADEVRTPLDPLDANAKADKIDRYVEATTQAYCASMVECCQVPTSDAYEVCLVNASFSRSSLFGSANLDNIYFNAEAAERCLAEKTNSGCGAFDAEVYAKPDSCADVYQAKLKPGAPCSHAEECVASRGFRSCSEEAPGGGSVCRVSKAVGLGDVCDTSCYDDQCSALSYDPPVLGECQAKDGLFCSPDAKRDGKPTCAPLVPRGESCSWLYACAPGNICEDEVCVEGTRASFDHDATLALSCGYLFR